MAQNIIQYQAYKDLVCDKVVAKRIIGKEQ
jgi:hypothetical protein